MRFHCYQPEDGRNVADFVSNATPGSRPRGDVSSLVAAAVSQDLREFREILGRNDSLRASCFGALNRRYQPLLAEKISAYGMMGSREWLRDVKVWRQSLPLRVCDATT
jgi:hypothetical protein